MTAEPTRIALVKLSALGDVVHALPAAAALRARHPRCRLTWIVERREAALLRGHPALDEVLALDTRGWRRARRPARLLEVARTLLQVGRRLRAGRFDVALDLQGLIKSGILTAATGAPLRVGFAASRCREPLSALFTNRRLHPPPAARHVIEQNLALLRPLGVNAPAVDFTLPVDPVADARIERVFAGADLKPRDRVVTLVVGAARPEKRWPVARFGALAARLGHEEAARVLVVWGPREEAAARAIVDAAPAARAVLAPPTDLDELTAVLRRASVVVGGDTGPLHVAAALGTPCVGLYGPTSAVRNGPYGPGHRALQSPDGRLASITEGDVARAVGEILDGGLRGAGER